jgi:hypothetical protein
LHRGRGGLASTEGLVTDGLNTIQTMVSYHDGNWVSLRVNGHLRPSTLRGSLVGRTSPITKVSVGFGLYHHLDVGTILLPESLMRPVQAFGYKYCELFYFSTFLDYSRNQINSVLEEIFSKLSVNIIGTNPLMSTVI